MNAIMNSLNYTEEDYYIWLAGFWGVINNGRRKVLYFTRSDAFGVTMNLAVVFNTIVLALDGLVSEND